jgi:hypothetical protein
MEDAMATTKRRAEMVARALRSQRPAGWGERDGLNRAKGWVWRNTAEAVVDALVATDGTLDRSALLSLAGVEVE